MTSILPDNGTVTVCEGVVRWVVREQGRAALKLQQQWSVMTMQDGKLRWSIKVWRDVPIVEEQS